jgi:hypothetical protein
VKGLEGGVEVDDELRHDAAKEESVQKLKVSV